ncbi:MAG TPA: TetR family transcriptional regulator [Longimicrobiales bacterium]|nr:TetR family transcriptional regulator [Longimicrobiales bacterium]
MSPRKRIIDDDGVLNAAARVLEHRRLEDIRLSDVALEAGLAAATLVQRFGTREVLLDAIGETYIREIDACFRQPAGSALDRLRSAIQQLPVAHHLKFYAARPACASRYSTALRKNIGFCLVEAVERGEVPPCDVADTARRFQIELYGLATAAFMENTGAFTLDHLVGELG